MTIKTYLIREERYEFTDNTICNDKKKAREIFLERKDDLLEENEFDEFVGQEWNKENIKELDEALKEEGIGYASEDFVQIDGNRISLEKCAIAS